MKSFFAFFMGILFGLMLDQTQISAIELNVEKRYNQEILQRLNSQINYLKEICERKQNAKR